MARRLRGSFPARVPSQRRLTTWEDGTGGTANTTITTGSAAFTGQAIQAILPGLTLIRMRGFFSVQLAVATAGGDGFNGAFGIGIATAAAVVAGAASVPTPLIEQDSDQWLYWQGFEVHGAQAFSLAGAPGLEQFGTYVNFEIDSKAMRKFDIVMSIYAMVETVETGTATAIIRHNSRTLLKLP